MTKSMLTATVFAALLPVSAFAQVTIQDYAFVQATSHVDLASVLEGQTAVTDASSPAVKNFAQTMVRTHSEGHDVLASMVTPQAKPLTTTKSPCLTWQAVLLQQKSWSPYDAAYIQATINNHERMLSVLQGEIQNGTDANLKDYAQKRLPGVEGSLADAKRLQAGGGVTVPADRERDLFPSGGYKLSVAGERALAAYAKQIAGLPVPIMVVGHTDNQRIGPELARSGVTSNEILSQKRAEAVKQYLVSQGLKADMIQAKGMGAAEPLASNDTADGRQQNRRVDINNAAAGGGSMKGLGAVSGVSECRG
jgi:flagellar motor protein MotB